MSEQNIVDVASEEAFAQLLAGETPVLVDFYADWCQPCRMMAPILSQIALERAGKLTVARVSTEDLPDLANRYGITAIPALHLFEGGEQLDRIVGYREKSQLDAFLDEHLGKDAQ